MSPIKSDGIFSYVEKEKKHGLHIKLSVPNGMAMEADIWGIALDALSNTIRAIQIKRDEKLRHKQSKHKPA